MARWIEVINGGNENIKDEKNEIRTERTTLVFFRSFRPNFYNHEDHEGCFGGYMCCLPRDHRSFYQHSYRYERWSNKTHLSQAFLYESFSSRRGTLL